MRKTSENLWGVVTTFRTMVRKHVECMFSRHGAKTCRMHVFAPWCQNMSYHIFSYKYLPSLQFACLRLIYFLFLSHRFILSSLPLSLPILYCFLYLQIFSPTNIITSPLSLHIITNCFSIFAEKVSQDVNWIVTYKTNEVKFSFISLSHCNTFFYFLSSIFSSSIFYYHFLSLSLHFVLSSLL